MQSIYLHINKHTHTYVSLIERWNKKILELNLTELTHNQSGPRLIKPCLKMSMVEHTFSSYTCEAEADGSLWIQSQHGLHSK